MTKEPADIKPTHKIIRDYYAALEKFKQQDVVHESAVRSAFQTLLAEAARKHNLTFIPELSVKEPGRRVVPDGTIRDEFNLPRGWWEAKDTDDDLDTEIAVKRRKGYPFKNIIFEDSRQGVLFQEGREILRIDLSDPERLARLLKTFFDYEEPNIEGFHQAIETFRNQIPEIGKGLAAIIKTAHKNNSQFIAAFDGFFTLCKTSLNPNLRQEAVDEMLVQHLLTERLFRTILDNADFIRKNVIAAEVEKVIDALTSKSLDRHELLKKLDPFYKAMENAAAGLTEFSDKQHFLNTVYERFFQGYAVDIADTHGIICTPQPVVDFMCASVEQALDKEFGYHLGSPGVHILDPCTGTGSFIVHLMHRIPKANLPTVYTKQLFANEVMLLPYYIAALNIEHTYYDITGEYRPFGGLCLVDTLDLADDEPDLFITMENAARVRREMETPITIIIGNPPYNVGQINENDNNKNRKYETVDKRVRGTYAKDSAATNKNALFDAYVKFFRWSTDRLNGRDGIVCFVSNNSFVDQVAFDGMRKHLMQDFTRIYHLDLHGNVRKNPKLSGTTHNIFGIQVGVGVTVAVRCEKHRKRSLHYCRVPEFWRKEEKYEYLAECADISGVKWRRLEPDSRHHWLPMEHAGQFAGYIPLGTKETKSAKKLDVQSIFKTYGRGLESTRDAWVYNFRRDDLLSNVKNLIESYNTEVDRWIRWNRPKDIDAFVSYDDRKIKWSSRLKEYLSTGTYAVLDGENVRVSTYRPFVNMYLYFDKILNQRRSILPEAFPNSLAELENRSINVSGLGSSKPFHALMTARIPCLDILEKTQCFPFYVYDEDGTNRRENITDWALKQFREQYHDKKISKWDIFYYVYGLLHHPEYRAKYADCLKRELPRIPFAPDFRAFAAAGKKLAEWHLDYEKVEPLELKWIETEGVPLSYRVEDKMRLSKNKTHIVVNPSLTLAGIPPKAFEYRLGNRSALEWVIDQYQVKEDKRSGIVSDPNRRDDPEYIVRLVGRVIRVSLETVDLVNSLPKQFE